MSKTKSSGTTQPTFSNSVVKVNGQDAAKTYKNGNYIVSEYYQTPEQSAAQAKYSSLLGDAIDSINTFSPEYYSQKSQILAAQQKQGEQTINDTYTPMINSLKNDVASRFGTLNTSSFLDGLNDIEKNRSSAVGQLAGDMLLNSSALDSQELNNKYNYASLLSGLQNSSLEDVYNMLGLSRLSSDLLNSYNLANYNNAASQASSIDWTPYYLR